MPRLKYLKNFNERFRQGCPTAASAYQYTATYYLKEWFLNKHNISDNIDLCTEEGTHTLGHMIDAQLGLLAKPNEFKHEKSQSARRVWGMMTEEFQTTSIDVADYILLAVGSRFEEEDIPLFPASIEVALEMVDGYCEREYGATCVDREELAYQLFRFSCAFARAEEITDPAIRRKEQERRRRVRKRRSVHREKAYAAA